MSQNTIFVLHFYYNVIKDITKSYLMVENYIFDRILDEKLKVLTIINMFKCITLVCLISH